MITSEKLMSYFVDVGIQFFMLPGIISQREIFLLSIYKMTDS
jgi:hypothetical protein